MGHNIVLQGYCKACFRILCANCFGSPKSTIEMLDLLTLSLSAVSSESLKIDLQNVTGQLVLKKLIQSEKQAFCCKMLSVNLIWLTS